MRAWCSPRFHCCSPALSRLLPLPLRAVAGCWLLAAGWLGLLLGVVQPGPEPLPANLLQVACRLLPCRRFNHDARAASRSPVQNKNRRASLDPWRLLLAPAGSQAHWPADHNAAAARSSPQQPPRGCSHRRPNGRHAALPFDDDGKPAALRDAARQGGTGGLSSCRHATAPMPSMWVWWPWWWWWRRRWWARRALCCALS